MIPSGVGVIHTNDSTHRMPVHPQPQRHDGLPHRGAHPMVERLLQREHGSLN